MARNFKKIFENRIKEIDKEMVAAVKDKKWSLIAKLEVEKENLQKRLR